MDSVPGLGWANIASFEMGSETLRVPLSIHRHARQRLITNMVARGGLQGIILLCGGKAQTTFDTDGEPIFRQDSWFHYLFGVKEPGFWGTINLSTGQSTLFMPYFPDEYRVWCGPIHPPSHFIKLYNVEEVVYETNLSAWLNTQLSLLIPTSKIYILDGVNSDSGLRPAPLSFPGDETLRHLFDSSHMYECLSMIRAVKSEYEIEVMKYVAWVGSNAHVTVMRNTQIGMMEYQLEARFQYEIYHKGGCRHVAYTSICACGPNSAVLHYGHSGAPNDSQLTDGDMALLDMGAVYHGYLSQLDSTYFPVSGKFTARQRVIYEGVLAAQRAVFEAIRPGVSWFHCHRLAERQILLALVTAGVLIGDVEDMVACDLGAVFFPHGLGHLIGCDTHDVGGYVSGLTPDRPVAPGIKKLRTARVLEEGMVLTNEPGCYFIDYLLDLALSNDEQRPFINREVLSGYRSFGGVRLEDVVLVTATGVDNLTTCPRTVEEVEWVMAGGTWPPVVDTAPYLQRRWCTLSPDRSKMISRG
eukprot:gene4171-8290_t